jgi:hypothetical protein
VKVKLDVRNLIDAQGLSVDEFVSRAGLAPDVGKAVYDGQEVEIDLTALSRIATTLGVLPNEIVSEVEEPQPSTADGAAPPRDLGVPEQTLDEIKKD